tara:strand:+ start:533 stop:730 length:198 start_codon:yes stop_codon:yes gene_type:complete
MLCLNQVVELLKEVDEIELMEMLEISSEDLVDKFLDVIIEKQSDIYYKHLGLGETEEETDYDEGT